MPRDENHLKARSVSRRYEHLASCRKAFGLEPMEQLPPEYRVQPELMISCPRPPRLHYGLHVSSNTLCCYGVKHGLLSAKLINGSLEQYFGMVDVIKHLERLCGVELSLQGLLWTAEETWMISRYANYTSFTSMKMGPPDEEVFAVICRELAITATPKWYRVV